MWIKNAHTHTHKVFGSQIIIIIIINKSTGCKNGLFVFDERKGRLNIEQQDDKYGIQTPSQQTICIQGFIGPVQSESERQ
jgi:hypothetical protein